MTIYVPVDYYDDPYDGLERMMPFGFDERCDAKHFIETNMAQHTWKILPFTVYRHWPGNEVINRDQLKNQALAKLTTEEIEALGL